MKKSFLLLLFGFLLPGVGIAAISVADSASSSGTGSVTMNSSCAVGDLLVVFSQSSNSGSFGTVSDNTNTGNYTQPGSLQYFYSARDDSDSVSYLVCNVVGIPTISNSVGVGVRLSAMRLTGFVHTPTLDAISAWTIGTGTAVSLSATTGQPNEMLLSFGTTSNNGFTGTPAGWTQAQDTLAALTQSYYQLAASPGSVPFSGTLGGTSDWLNIIVGFYDASSASPAPLISNGHPLISNGHPVISQ